ncbi:MAG: hypothetical protein LBE22_00235 [Azoarcus sp.]|jgi:hypothetical protein|nr:hypothetical protein [Azoarcus sp.]
MTVQAPSAQIPELEALRAQVEKLNKPLTDVGKAAAASCHPTSRYGATIWYREKK